MACVSFAHSIRYRGGTPEVWDNVLVSRKEPTTTGGTTMDFISAFAMFGMFGILGAMSATIFVAEA